MADQQQIRDDEPTFDDEIAELVGLALSDQARRPEVIALLTEMLAAAVVTHTGGGREATAAMLETIGQQLDEAAARHAAEVRQAGL